jgi:hypothetical protein
MNRLVLSKCGAKLQFGYILLPILWVLNSVTHTHAHTHIHTHTHTHTNSNLYRVFKSFCAPDDYNTESYK